MSLKSPLIQSSSPALFCFMKLIFFFLVELGLCCSARAFSSCGEQGLLSSCGAPAPHYGGFSCGAQAVGAGAAVMQPCGAWAWLLHARHVGSSQTRGRTHVSCMCHQGSPEIDIFGEPRGFFKNFYLAAPCLSVAHQIFSCGIWTLSCSLWDLVPWPGIKTQAPLHWERGVSEASGFVRHLTLDLSDCFLMIIFRLNLLGKHLGNVSSCFTSGVYNVSSSHYWQCAVWAFGLKTGFSWIHSNQVLIPQCHQHGPWKDHQLPPHCQIQLSVLRPLSLDGSVVFVMETTSLLWSVCFFGFSDIPNVWLFSCLPTHLSLLRSAPWLPKLSMLSAWVLGPLLFFLSTPTPLVTSSSFLASRPCIYWWLLNFHL